MKIRCLASIVLDADEPIACIRKFVAALRAGAVDTGAAAIELNLVGTSARARTTLQEFRPERVKSAPFGQALDVVDELTQLSPARIKSLHFILAAKGFRWMGSSPGSSARLVLIDTKSIRRKQRFYLTAQLYFEALSTVDPSVDAILAAVGTATGIGTLLFGCGWGRGALDGRIIDAAHESAPVPGAQDLTADKELAHIREVAEGLHSCLEGAQSGRSSQITEVQVNLMSSYAPSRATHRRAGQALRSRSERIALLREPGTHQIHAQSGRATRIRQRCLAPCRVYSRRTIGWVDARGHSSGLGRPPQSTHTDQVGLVTLVGRLAAATG